MGKLHLHPWTNEEMLSIFRIKTPSDEVRKYITAVLRQIHHEEVAAFNDEYSKMQIVMNNLRKQARRILDGTVWNDEHLAMLHEALYAPPKGEPQLPEIPLSKRLFLETPLPETSPTCQESASGVGSQGDQVGQATKGIATK
jgi:hypothetical protein